tara:strand:+ start:2551 stop:2886 length:336 start_codon:yes stop_codon:yes gene_type:complete
MPIVVLREVAFDDRFALVARDGAVTNTASVFIAAQVIAPPESLINEERNVLLPDLLIFVRGVPPNLNRDGRCVVPYPLPDVQGSALRLEPLLGRAWLWASWFRVIFMSPRC